MRTTLDDLAARGADALRDRNVRFYLREGIPLSVMVGTFPPAIVLGVQFFQRLAGVEPWQPGPWGLAAAMGLAVLLTLWLIASWARRMDVDRATALGLIDRAVDADERLVTADALLREGRDDAFSSAAIEDARWFLKPAATAEPDLPPAPKPTSSLTYAVLFALAGIAFFLSALDPSGLEADPELAIETGEAPHRIPDLETPVETADRPAPETPPAAVRPPPGSRAPETKTTDAATEAVPTELPDEAMRKEGKGGAGRSAQAQGSRGNNDAQGAPTQQGQQTPKAPVVKKPLPKTKKRKKKKDRKEGDDEPPEKQQGEESGSTAGKGSSRGSNKNAVTSDWKSKDQVTTDEDEDIEDDEEVEDEEVDSEARGGVQPNLRSRKPPVSRDLTIGFGNQPNPNANGRGGPSQPKKSRGTASLVLGVPIPDRIKGQPNPGKTKVTQERVEPRRERATPATAEARAPRTGPTGPLARPHLEPWMQEMLRAWFLTLRQQETTTR